MSFDIQEGDATKTLKKFAKQAQLGIIFNPRNIAKHTTQAISGLYTPSDALRIMLTETQLKYTQDADTGIFAVTKFQTPSAHTSSASQNHLSPNSQPDTNMTTKIPKNEPSTPRRRTNVAKNVLSGLFSFAIVGSFPDLSAQDDSDDIVELAPFEVFSSNQASSVKKKKDADIIGSYLSADTLGELPDDNLGEALSRLAGINVVDGAVTIRGAEGQYNTIRINGAAQANAQLASRNFDVTQIPSEMVAGVEVIKSITAEHPADSIGGYVNVRTANAFDRGDNYTSYKLSSRYRDQADEWGEGINIIRSDVMNAFGGENNFGVLLNFNYVDEDIMTWSTQNRYAMNPGRLGDSDPSLFSLDVNPDASIPIWDRFDPNEVRRSVDNLTLDVSFDLKVSDNTSLYFRPLYQTSNDYRDSFAFRIDRMERAFGGNYWFLDDDGNAMGTWEDSDGDTVLGSAGDTFIQETDANGFVIMTPNFEANNDGRIARIVTNDQRDSDTYTLDFGGETRFANGLLEYRALYSTDDGSRYRRQWRFEERFDDARSGDPLRMRMTNGGTPLPIFTVFEVTEKKGHVPSNGKENVFSDANRTFSNGGARFLQEDVHEDVQLFNIDYTHDVSETLTFKTGLRVRKAHRDNVANEIFTQQTAGTRRVDPAGQFAEASDAGNFTLWDGIYSDIAGPFITADPLYDYFFEEAAANPDNWEFQRADLLEAADTAELNEDIYSTYFQATKKWENLTVVAGVRYEKTKLDTTWKPSNFIVDGNAFGSLNSDQSALLSQLVEDGLDDLGYLGDSSTFSFGDLVDDINKKNDYDNYLPSLVATYRVGETGHQFRFAYGNTLTRPDYQQLVPFDLGIANAQLQAANILGLTNRDDEFHLGNPSLLEQTSENFDLAWEYYFGPRQGNSISVSLFSKDLEDFLQEDVFSRDVEQLIDPEDPSLGTEFVRADTEFWSNASTRHIEGIEISGYFNFSDLFPDFGLIKGLSFVPNYAHIVGDQSDPIYDLDALEAGNFEVLGYEEIPSLRNQAKDIYNLQFIYEKGPLNIRASYNFISELQVTSSTAAISAITFDTERENVDLSVQYKLSKNNDMRLYVEANNLTSAPSDEKFIGTTPGLFTTSFFTEGRRIVAGIRGSF